MVTLEPESSGTMVLRLYIAGDTIKSRQTISNLKDICNKYLPGKCDVEVIDLSKHPDLAVGKNISALPTLIKELPKPMRTLVGDLASKEKVLVALDIKHTSEAKKPAGKPITAEELKAENEKLLADIARLRSENDHLRRMLRNRAE